MACKTTIEWTHMSWNPVTGCTKVSQGCKFCYAERMAHRLRAMGVERYRRGFNLTLHEDLLDLPKSWREPRLIFVNSMSDLFHEQVPEAFILRVFETMEACPQHVFQVLTKRSGRLATLSDMLSWPPNVWVGVSVENSQVLDRVEHLKLVPACVRFLSCEPLLGPLNGLDLSGIHWVIVGGESGPGARSMQPEWARHIRDLCASARVPFFFKQWGGVHKSARGRILDGRTHDEFPRGRLWAPLLSP